MAEHLIWSKRKLYSEDAMTDADTSIRAMRDNIEAFVEQREWAQFHNAKDLAAAIAIEAAELMELFLWQAPDEVAATTRRPDSARRIREELADVFILCCCLANRLEIDVSTAVGEKVRLNAAK